MTDTLTLLREIQAELLRMADAHDAAAKQGEIEWGHTKATLGSAGTAAGLRLAIATIGDKIEALK